MSDEIRTEQLDDEKEHERLRKIVEEKMPPEEDIYDLAELFKTFGDSTRMRILFVLLESEACVCGLASVLNMTDSAISHQLRCRRMKKATRSGPLFSFAFKVFFYCFKRAVAQVVLHFAGIGKRRLLVHAECHQRL